MHVLEIFETPETDLRPMGPIDWMDVAACAGHSDMFFAPFAERPEARVRREASARVICEGCVGLGSCREYARTNRELGFWGGESESERAEAGFPPTTPIIGRKRIAEQRARDAMASAS
jgi:WhiB family redox-sensing transcriptional regulator